MILSCSDKISRKTIRHVNIVGVTRGVRLDETDSPKDDGEDKGADGQHEVAHHLGKGELHDVFSLFLLFIFNLLFSIDNIHL